MRQLRDDWIFVAIATAIGGLVAFMPHYVTLILVVLFVIKMFLLDNRIVKVVALCVMILFIGYTWLYKANHFSRLDVGQKQWEMFVDARDIEVNGDQLTLKGTIEGEKVVAYYRLSSEQEKSMWEKSSSNYVLYVTGELKAYEPSRNFFQFDYADYMKEMQNSFYQSTISQYVVLHESPNYIKVWQQSIKNVVPPLIFSLIEGIIFGQLQDIHLSQVFQLTGILYLISLSGIHIRFVKDVCASILKRLGVTLELVIIICKGIVIIVGFIAGLHHQSVIKVIGLSWLPKKLSHLDKISLIAIALLLHNPYRLFSLSFQMGIGLHLLYLLIPDKKRVLMWLWSAIIFSYHFYEVSWLPLVLVPIGTYFLRGLLLPSIWLVSLFYAFIPSNVYSLMEKIYEIVVVVIDFLAHQPMTKIVTGRLENYQYMLLFIALCIVSVGISRKKWLCLLGVCVIVAASIPQRFVMLDVGQGHSFLIQQDGKNILIDTGGDVLFAPTEQWKSRIKKDFAHRILLPSLKALRVSKLDAVFITHADSDHVGALDTLRHFMPIEKIYYAKGAPIDGTHSLLGQSQVNVGSLTFDVLWPQKEGKGDNEHSIVLKFPFLDKTWLMTGDAGESSEREMLRLFPNLKSDVLQAGHHGSQYSTSELFLKAVNPNEVLISSGKNNRYRHPHEQLLERIKDLNIYRTDVNGAHMYTQKDGWISQLRDASE